MTSTCSLTTYICSYITCQDQNITISIGEVEFYKTPLRLALPNLGTAESIMKYLQFLKIETNTNYFICGNFILLKNIL